MQYFWIDFLFKKMLCKHIKLFSRKKQQIHSLQGVSIKCTLFECLLLKINITIYHFTQIQKLVLSDVIIKIFQRQLKIADAT